MRVGEIVLEICVDDDDSACCSGVCDFFECESANDGIARMIKARCTRFDKELKAKRGIPVLKFRRCQACIKKFG
ncbi:MAG TPA: hypothetical protein VKO61_01450 [Candidatus Paceibacterota bacterium]|nr:hypothetical protein [Candidatus Paceibacterota bacterium]